MKTGHVCDSFEITTIADLQEEYLENETEESLNKLRNLCIIPGVNNAWKDIDFGDNDRGIFGVTPVCLLHTFLFRFPKDVFDFFMEMNGKTVNTKKNQEIERSLPKFISKHIRQSVRDMPRLSNFTTILTRQEKSKTDANKLYVKVFALYLFSLTTYSIEMLKSGKTKSVSMQDIRKRMRLLKQTLTVHQFLHQERIAKELFEPADGLNIKVAKKVLDKYLYLYLSVKADTGSDTIVPKFHYIQHILNNIKYFGSSRAVDGATSESNFKILFKKPASQTQK